MRLAINQKSSGWQPVIITLIADSKDELDYLRHLLSLTYEEVDAATDKRINDGGVLVADWPAAENIHTMELAAPLALFQEEEVTP